MMARKAKIDNVLKKRLERTEKKRLENTRNELVYFLIVCEGTKTEPNYFRSLKDRLAPHTVDLKIEGTGFNTVTLVEETIKLEALANRKYDRVWVVFDKDDFPEQAFNQAIAKAEANGIRCAWTNEAFELWFLLHFEYINTPTSRKDYKANLERQIKKHSGDQDYEYTKNDPNTYALLQQYGNQTQAIAWALKLQQQHTSQKFASHNPCTRVHELINELQNPIDILNETN